MAFGCVLYLKGECDGCGECDRVPFADDDKYDPFIPDCDDEE